MSEEWRDIIGYEGWYQVSDCGRVKRIKPGSGTIPGYILKLNETNNGYHTVGLSKNGVSKIKGVHVLVCESFNGKKPQGSYEVNHIDGNKTNNTPKNLEWVTRSENTIHAYKSLNMIKNRGEDHGLSKLTEEEVVEIRNLYSQGNITHAQLGKIYNIHPSAITRIINRKRWKHI